MRLLRSILSYKRYPIAFFAICISIGALFLPLGSEDYPWVTKLLSVILLMGIFWIFEVIPIPVTSLIPIVILPVYGILSNDEVVKSYLNDSQALFFGSFTVAFAMERWKLHQRIALFLLQFQGDRPRLLFLSFLLITAVLSMFISNSAATSLMVPIVISLLHEVELQLKKNLNIDQNEVNDSSLIEGDEGEEEEEEEIKEESNGQQKNIGSENEVSIELEEIKSSSSSSSSNQNIKNDNRTEELETQEMEKKNNDDLVVVNIDDVSNINNEIMDDRTKKLRTLPESEKHAMIKEFKYYKIGLLIGISYSATIGGITTLIGTPSNLMMAADMKQLFPDSPEINFFSWFLFCLPLSIFMLACSFYILAIGAKCNFRSNLSFDKKFFQLEYQKLGRITIEEIIVFIDFSILIAIWFLKSGFGKDSFFSGWGERFPNVGYGTTSIFFAILLFLIPAPSLKYKKSLLRWGDLARFPWDTMILLGSGYAIANAFEASRAQYWIAHLFEKINNIPLLALIFIISLATSFLTEFSSNVAIASIFIPAVSAIAISLGKNPLFTVIPATIACSFAFMLPIATPGNSIVFASGAITIPMMAKRGFLLNLLGVCSVTIYSYLAIPFFFDASYNSLPSWAQ